MLEDNHTAGNEQWTIESIMYHKMVDNTEDEGGDDELFLQNGWLTKNVKPHLHPRALPEVFNKRNEQYLILCRIKYYYLITATPQHYKDC